MESIEKINFPMRLANILQPAIFIGILVNLHVGMDS